MRITSRIEGYDGYFIDTEGNVYCNLGRGNKKKNKKTHDKLYKIKCRKTKKNYLRVCMRNPITNKRDERYVHRLVAITFIPNPENKPEVNHKDCNPLNNNVKNLEWATRKENLSYSDNLGHYKRDKKGKYIKVKSIV